VYATRWGWHRLADAVARRIVADAGISPGDLVLDLGAGTGALVIAFELHAGRAAALRQRFRDAPVKVVQADLGDLHLPGCAFRVVSNPPFASTAAIMRRLTHPRSQLVRADLILPAYAAHRWATTTHFAVRATRRLPPRAFRPAPPNPAVVVVIERRARAAHGDRRVR
jgi:23S rRNA (adenine-N6)-dimethyltransferase